MLPSSRAPLAPAFAQAGTYQLAQSDAAGTAVEPGEENPAEEDSIPPNILEQEKPTLPDTSATTPAPVDSIRNALPVLPETLRYVPPVDSARVAKPSAAPAPVAPKRSGGILGLTPAVVLIGLAALHIFIVRTVGD